MNRNPASTENALAQLRCVVEADGDIQEGLAAIAEHPTADGFVWQHPATGRAVVALGCATEVRSSGPLRFEQAHRAWQKLIAETSVDYGNSPVSNLIPAAPLLVGGFGFFDNDPPQPWQDFPALRFVLPKHTWLLAGGRCYKFSVQASANSGDRGSLEPGSPASVQAVGVPTLGNRMPASGSEMPTARNEESVAAWIDRAAAAISRIDRREIVKIVLARSRSLELASNFSPLDAIERLGAERPSCATFLVRHGATAFFGSSPEMLARADHDGFYTAALAGSAPRGNNDSEDFQSAEFLRSCPKNAREHSVVVKELRAKLAPICTDVQVASVPELRELPEAFHLATPFRGHLARRRGLFDLAGALHPTAAVCGIPSRSATQTLARDEPGRGWYAGATGWIDAGGHGELTVALRSALVDGERALVWAGAGIVDGSRPESELAEVETKMTALAGVLHETADEAVSNVEPEQSAADHPRGLDSTDTEARRA